MQAEPAPGARRQAVSLASAKPQPLLVGLLVAAAIMAASAPHAFARPAPQSFADLVEEVAPAVVTVATVRVVEAGERGPGRDQPVPPDSQFPDDFKRFFEGPQGQEPEGRPAPRAQGLGSGFILDRDGTVITNNHVVEGASEITVTLKNGKTFEAELLGGDEKTDLAVLKIKSDEALPYVSFGNSDKVRVGDWVMAVGNPFGLGGTVTAGIVSARGRDISGALIDFLQIDAAINRGNSGGPAFNGDGEVVGINTAIFTPNGGSVGIGFAIPSNLAENIVAQLKTEGRVERGWLGVQIQPVTPEFAEGFGLEEARGALIAAIQSDSPAESAGLEAGDVILSWDGREIEDPRDLARKVAATDPGKTVEVELWRERKQTTVEVRTGEAEEKVASRGGETKPQAKPQARLAEVPGTGLSLATLTPALRDRYGLDPDLSGVLIAQVAGDSPASEEGLRRGDVLLSIDLAPVTTAQDAAMRFMDLRKEGRNIVPLMVSRGDSQGFYALRLEDA